MLWQSEHAQKQHCPPSLWGKLSMLRSDPVHHPHETSWEVILITVLIFQHVLHDTEMNISRSIFVIFLSWIMTLNWAHSGMYTILFVVHISYRYFISLFLFPLFSPSLCIYGFLENTWRGCNLESCHHSMGLRGKHRSLNVGQISFETRRLPPLRNRVSALFIWFNQSLCQTDIVCILNYLVELGQFIDLV